MVKITLEPIGIIHSPFKSRNDAPIQPHFAKDICGTIELNPKFKPALKDLDGFSHITLIYHLHKSEGYKLDVKPFIDLVEQILSAKRTDTNVDTSSLEAEIDRMVYELYVLTDGEIRIVEESVIGK